jgi:hypothetical protein
MRFTVTLVCALILATGCSTPSGPANPIPIQPGKEIGADLALHGRVVQVNPQLRYVLIDFSLRQMPDRGQRLDIYRADQKVGTVRISGPFIETTAVGDVLTGEAQVGDDVLEPGQP